jgi:Protein of unknown function (DUF3298).
MKRALAILTAAILVFTLAACSNQPKKTSGKKSKEASSKALELKKPSAEYRYKTEKYSYDQNNRKYSASYPQLSQDAQNYQKANALLKNTALQTIQSAGEGKTDVAVLIRVKGELSYNNDSFLSATFKETSQTASKEPVTAFRAVNFDLKNGKTLTAADLIKENDALDALLLKEAKSHVDSDLKSSVTADVIKSGMKSCSLYFEKTKLGFSLPVSQKLQGHIEVELKYEDVKPFMTDNGIWKELGAK